jgi:hypothetical protein
VTSPVATELIAVFTNGVISQNWVYNAVSGRAINMFDDVIIASGENLTLTGGDLTMTGSLSVTGDAAIDDITLNGTQINTTSGNLSINSNGGNVLFTTDNISTSTGDLTIGTTTFKADVGLGTVGIGTTPTSNALLTVQDTLTLNDSFSFISGAGNITVNTADKIYKSLNYTANYTNNANVLLMCGITSTIGIDSTSVAHTIAELCGIETAINISGSGKTATKTVTDLYHLRVKTPSYGASANIITEYGLWLPDISGGATSWAIASNGGDSYHVGNLRIGDTTSPSNLLELYNGDLSFHGTARIAWTKITANSVTLSVGSTPASTVSDLQTAHDGNLYHIDEAGGVSPAITLIVDFISVNAFNWVQIIGEYDGGATHAVNIEVYNWSTTNWDIFDSHDGVESGLTDHSFLVPDDTNYIGTGGSAGQVRVRLNHTQNGNGAHDFDIDVVTLYQ